MALIRLAPNSYICVTHKITELQNNLKIFLSNQPPPPLLPSRPHSITRRGVSTSTHSVAHKDVEVKDSPFSGLDEVMMGFLFGKKKSTEVAHAVWKNVVRKGDLVVDATCGNGYDTLALLRMVADDTRRGRVIAMDLQKDALQTTSTLLDFSVTAHERGLVDLYAMCHTKMEDLVPRGAAVRLVAFNLGYLPGGDKRIKTEPATTLLALEAAKRIVSPGGLISILAYVGHSGGRDELEKVESFAAELPVNSWACCKLQMLNRPSAPVLVLLSRK